jgi:hypothetical protein
VIQRCAAGDVYTHANHAADKNVAGKAGGTARGNPGRDCYLLALKTGLGEGSHEFFLAAELKRAGRHADMARRLAQRLDLRSFGWGRARLALQSIKLHTQIGPAFASQLCVITPQPTN